MLCVNAKKHEAGATIGTGATTTRSMTMSQVFQLKDTDIILYKEINILRQTIKILL